MKQEGLLNELIEQQRKLLLKTARRIVPQITDDDLLQVSDFQELENHPHFRYEEGVLHGFQAVKAALLARISHRNERKVVQDAALDFENREEVNIASIIDDERFIN